MEVLQSALIIFSLRVVDMTAATMRILMLSRGRKAITWGLGFFQALVFIVAIRAVIADLENWLNVVGYAAGFASGNVVGMWIEERLAIGYVHMRIISPGRGAEIAEHLRANGYAVTEISGRGKDGVVTLLNCSVRRRRSSKVRKIVNELDENAFITTENVKAVRRGFWR
ncbi:MAG: DUF5698 domain-containing protein [Anaerolineales bacterium]|jgi:uncharacterized protein YebE (UPF0316 family)